MKRTEPRYQRFGEPASQRARGGVPRAEVLTVGEVSIVEATALPDQPATGPARVDALYRASWDGCGGMGWWCVRRAGRTIQVYVPRSAVPMPDAAIDRVVERRPVADAPVYESLIRPMLLGMAGRLEALSRSPMADLDTVCSSLVTMLLRSLDTTKATDGPNGDGVTDDALRLRAWRFIEANLTDPGLGPEEVAAALYVSRRTLYQLLSVDGTGVAAAIRGRRLHRARSMLLDPACRHSSIAEIAAQVGLPNPAHFSRLFHAEFSETPRQARARLRDHHGGIRRGPRSWAGIGLCTSANRPS